MTPAGQGSQQHGRPQDIRLVVDTIPARVHSALPDGDLGFFNQPWLEYEGVPMDHLLGWGWTNAAHPDDVAGIVAKWRACLARGEIFEYEARVSRAVGEYRRMVHRKVTLRDDRGNIIKWHGSSIDIEDMTRADERVMKNERELQLAIDTVLAAISTSLPQPQCQTAGKARSGETEVGANQKRDRGKSENLAKKGSKYSG